MDELIQVYRKFEQARLAKAERQLNKKGLKPDTFAKFLVERTDLCPHKVLTPTSEYWLETLSLIDGEHGLTLPSRMENLPGLFFDAMAVIRNTRSKVREEEKR